MALDFGEMDYKMDAYVRFPPFRLLPIELRQMIWEYSVSCSGLVELSIWRFMLFALVPFVPMYGQTRLLMIRTSSHDEGPISIR
jgi:hypothetical protein